jgi:hypothetical protein
MWPDVRAEHAAQSAFYIVKSKQGAAATLEKMMFDPRGDFLIFTISGEAAM